MKNFEKLIEDCLIEVESVGIVAGKIENWKINYRAKARWGLCRKLKNGAYEIEIAAQLLEDDRVSEFACKNTMIHEILHTCGGCMKHTGKWLEYAKEMNEAYGYRIKRCTSSEEKGLERRIVERREVKYKFVCYYCGDVVRKTRKCKFTKYYRNYKCMKCGRSRAYRRA